MNAMVWQEAEGRVPARPMWSGTDTIAIPATPSREGRYQTQGVSNEGMLENSISNPVAEEVTHSFSRLTHLFFHAAWVCFALSLPSLLGGLIVDEPVWSTIGLLFFAASSACLLVCMHLAKSEKKHSR